MSRPGAFGGAAAGAVANLTHSYVLGADQTSGGSNLFVDGPSGTFEAGTWLLVGMVTCIGASAGAQLTMKLWDGTTVYASAESELPVAANGENLMVATVVTLGSSATLRLSVASSNGTVTIKAATPHNAAGNNASQLSGIRTAQ